MFIAVDTGASKTLIALVTKSGKITARTKFPTPRNTNEYVTNVQNAITELIGTDTPDVIIVALPGVIRHGIAVECPNLGWKNFNIRPPLAARFPSTPILIENDANLAGLGETHALRPMPRFTLYVTVSTGIGTGFTTDGEIDPSLRLSEGGSITVEYDGIPRRWETFAAGSAIYKAYGKYARDIKSKHVWNDVADRISRGFLAIIPLTQPDVIIIGGSIGTYFDRYGEQLEKILHEKLPSHIARPPIRQAKHPEEAVIYGCYYHARNYLAHQTTSR